MMSCLRVSKILTVAFFIQVFSAYGCSPTKESNEINPTVVTGYVLDGGKNPVVGARVSLSTVPFFDGVFTDSHGLYKLTDFPAGKHRLKVEKLGYEIYEADVSKSENSVATMNIVLTSKTYIIPDVKPLSVGTVRIRDKILETDFDGDGTYQPFVVKGAAFSPVPIGNLPVTSKIYDRCIQWIVNLNANTVRTYSGVDKYFLQKAAENNIRVIVGFWVNLDLDLSLPGNKQKVIDDFASFILDLKEYPAVLMWNIGNEQNYSTSPNNGDSPYWYSLVHEMALTAYKIEGAKYHPVCISNGGYRNIGDSSMLANDSSLTYVDLWASNAYERNFDPFFSSYRSKSNKPIVITEFGIDALNNISKTEYESVQAYFDSTNWVQIRNASHVCVGATVFEFTDEWWKAGDLNAHDFGGYATNAHPDGYSNEEWWGIIAVTPDTTHDGLDEWRARKAYTMFQQFWK
ncbi:MAG: carboxypeptidase-like regulatory domain-containing protein [Bacteroidota bacterium]|nr:carboxypeptidase-like regulatory domain-containing protein [Bacteroidota bacterium]